MRILVIHDRYRDNAPSGENAIVDWEAAALRALGHDVRMLQPQPETFAEPQWKRGLQHLGGFYSFPWRNRTREALDAFRPDLVHVHNYWPHVTGSVYYACAAAGVPVVQTIHNYRLLCLSEFLERDRRPCELCLRKTFAWPGALHRCVNGEPIASLVKMTSIGLHKALGTWSRLVDTFILPSETTRAKFLAAGFDAGRMRVKPSCAVDHGMSLRPREYFCFAGRLSEEKGVDLVVKAWTGLRGVPLRIAGAGPLQDQVAHLAAGNPDVAYLGLIPVEAVATLMGGAIATLLPSHWDEPSPVVAMQSLSVGTPLIASDLGTRAAMVQHGKTGLVFPGGDLEAFRARIDWAHQHPAELREFGHAARLQFEQNFSIEQNVGQLLAIYEETLQARRDAAAKG